jgi:hypothetical protein
MSDRNPETEAEYLNVAADLQRLQAILAQLSDEFLGTDLKSEADRDRFFLRLTEATERLSAVRERLQTIIWKGAS